MPLVTVITGYYNRAEALDVTIDSIMNQSFKDFEFIVFNDCSTDDTKERLELIAEKYNDPRLIIRNFEKNMGFVDGLKMCIAEASGKYICIQGSGDFSYPDRLKYQVKALENDEKIAVVGSFYENFVEDRNIIRLRNKVADNTNKESLLKGNVFSHGEVMFRLSTYNQAGGYRSFFKNCQDYDLWLRMIEFGRLHTVQELLYRRFIRYDGVSYHPEKYLKQVRYFDICQAVNRLPLHEQNKFISDILSRGLEDSVELSQKRIQKRIISAVLRSVAWAKYGEASKLCAIGVKNILVKTLLLSFVNLYQTKIFSPVRILVSKKIGLSSTN